MSTPKQPLGRIGWVDLTVADADGVRKFYEQVVGWEWDAVEMDGYEDYCAVTPKTGEPVAGLCHARGGNADLPPQWLIYITVADLAASLKACELLGGEILCPPRDLGESGQFAVIRDPAGAVSALFQARK